jgi:hypothetical protein
VRRRRFELFVPPVSLENVGGGGQTLSANGPLRNRALTPNPKVAKRCFSLMASSTVTGAIVASGERALDLK